MLKINELVAESWRVTHRAKIAKKVHKRPLRVNVINFELNGFNHRGLILVLYGLMQQDESQGVTQVPKIIMD